MECKRYFLINHLSKIFVLLILFATSCKINPAGGQINMGIVTNIKTVDLQTGTIFDNKNDTVIISKLGDIILYRKSIQSIKYNKNAFKDGQIQVNNDPKMIESSAIFHRFYIYKKDQETGKSYEFQDKAYVIKQFSVDTLLLDDPILKGGNADFDENSILVSKSDIGNGYIRETYTYKPVPSANYPDTTFLTFDKNWKSRMDYTLSQNIDKVRGIKLVQVSSIFNVVPKNKSSLGVEIPNRIIDVKIFEPNLSKAELNEINQVYQKFKLEKK
ncbi:hypothetical protein GJU39_10810 [Pedobacter petrophilus]|uniref:Uncharacterized protein n=2 Tax=Pedobacter petrophilus TaxID=1908241 RepID=A0A7K0FYX7_9SPHI|nr:hypothetical protein [Pedobacter petrophilus]